MTQNVEQSRPLPHHVYPWERVHGLPARLYVWPWELRANGAYFVNNDATTTVIQPTVYVTED